MHSGFKAIVVVLAVIALCAALIVWSAEKGRGTGDVSEATVGTFAAVVSTTEHAGEPTAMTKAPEPASPTTTTEPIRITVAAVGDVLPHMPIVNSVRDGRTGSYDFRPVLRPVAPYLRSADYTVANLETRLAGAARGYSGYPLFNSPAEVAAALRWAGIDMVATANNHSLDMGWTGLLTTLDNLDEAGLAHVGTYRSREERVRPVVIDIQGIRVGFINYTAGLNGLSLPEGKDYGVARLYLDEVAGDIVRTRMWGAEIVIALLHYGNEYQREPSAEQVAISQELLARGVDVIIGSHPHVVQPVERVLGFGGGKTADKAGGKYVVYSLGNFVSGQRWRYSDSGLMVYVHIEKTEMRTRVTGISYLPVYVQRSPAGGAIAYRVLPVLPGVEVDGDLPVGSFEEARMAAVWEELRPLLYHPDENIVPLGSGNLGL